MAIRNIRMIGDDILTKKCKVVKEMTEKNKELIADMFDTMYDADGVGLAAPQVGIMQKTKGGCRWTIRLSNKDYAQKEVIRMFGYLLANGDYATESDIFRKGIKSLYENKKSINNMDYVLAGDYYIPDLKLPNEERPIGKYGRLHREYLKSIAL